MGLIWGGLGRKKEGGLASDGSRLHCARCQNDHDQPISHSKTHAPRMPGEMPPV